MRFQCKKGPFSDMRTESCAQMLRMLRTGVDLELGLGLQPWGLGGATTRFPAPQPTGAPSPTQGLQHRPGCKGNLHKRGRLGREPPGASAGRRGEHGAESRPWLKG